MSGVAEKGVGKKGGKHYDVHSVLNREDAKLTRRVSISFPTDSIFFGGGGIVVGGGDGEGELDLLQDDDGKSDGDGEDDDGKSDGGDDNDESDMMRSRANTPARGVVTGKRVGRDENSFTYDSNLNFVDNSPNPPPKPPTDSYEFCRNYAHYSHDCPPQESSTPLRDIIIFELPLCIAITPILSTKEPKDSLIIGDEHLDTIPEKKLDEFIKSSVENLVPNPCESEDLSDIEKIISIKIDPHHFNVESDFIESLLNQYSLIISSSKIDSLLDEFAGELIFLKSIPPRIDEADCDPEEEIHLIKKFFYDNSSPRPTKEFNSKTYHAIIESFSPSPIFAEDSDSLMEEIDLSLTLDDSMPSNIKNDDYDSEGDILFLK
nr:hypothetical protein [Tanacetum cinerariifolium]